MAVQDEESSELHVQFQSTEENGEPATVRLEDSLGRTEIDMYHFLIAETASSPAVNKHILSPVHQMSKPNFEFLEGGSRSSFLYRRLQRPSVREKKMKRMGKCENLSTFAWLFLSLALLQIIMVSGLQIAIGVLQSSDQDRYTECVAESMNVSVTENTSAPEFGDDKLIYICFFEFLVIYNFSLCIYALLVQSIVEIFAFVCVNILMLAYSCIQVYQFRGFATDYCPKITIVGYIALVSTGVILVFTVIFAVMTIKLFTEFGWKQYRFVNCNPALRFYYRYYLIFLSVLKLQIIFMVTFLIGQCILIFSPWQRPPLDYEFVLSILFALGMVFLYFAGNLTVRRESHIGTLVLVIIGVLLFFYSLFKVVRYATRTCPRCMDLRDELNDTTNPVNARREDFEHLVLFASLNMFFTLLYLSTVIRVWTQYGKGLADHFYFTGHFFDRIGKREPSQVAKRDALGTGYTTRLANKAVSVDQIDASKRVKPHRGSSLDADYHPTTPTASSPMDNLLKQQEIHRTTSLPV